MDIETFIEGLGLPLAWSMAVLDVLLLLFSAFFCKSNLHGFPYAILMHFFCTCYAIFVHFLFALLVQFLCTVYSFYAFLMHFLCIFMHVLSTFYALFMHVSCAFYEAHKKRIKSA